MKTKSHLLLGILAVAFAIAACALPGNTAEPQVVTVVVTATAPSPTPPATATPAPSATPVLAVSNTPAPSATTGPQCRVLRRLNFRNGPGTAYVPILGVFDIGVTLTPTGFNPVGSPGDAWVQVVNPQNNQVGWVSAGAEFIDCNIDLTQLPSVAVQPPPTPSAPKVSNKPPDGPTGGDIEFEIVMDPNYLMQIRARIEDTGHNGDGIDTVTFIIQRSGEEVYKTTEGTASFCIFNGGEPNCNPWPKTNGRYTWGAGGPEIETGDYKATIRVTRDLDNSYYDQWTFDFTVDLP